MGFFFLFLDFGRLLPSGRGGGMDSGQQTCGKLTAGLAILPLLLPCKFSPDNLNLNFYSPFDSNYLATNFQPIFNFSAHDLIGDYYITESIVGIISMSVALSP